MKVNLNIADYTIQLESADFELVPGNRFSNFLAEIPPLQGGPRGVMLQVRVFRGRREIKGERVFTAPYVEEIEGMRFTRKPEFWSLRENNDELYLKINFPDTSTYENAVLIFSLQNYTWELWIDSDRSVIDPMTYPIDSLILYYLTAMNGDIMIHASGVSHNGRGYLFSGVSGQGKSTMARLWKESGARVIHDDRLIIRRSGNGFRMYNTPIYDDEVPLESPVDALYLIGHGTSDSLAKVEGAKAVTGIMSNCIQHNWNKEIIGRLIHAISGLCSTVPVYRLDFVPGKKVIDYIRSNG